MPEVRWLVRECLDAGDAAGITLRQHTNGTLLDPKFYAEWLGFARIEVFVSVDAFGARNSYLRYPARWADVERGLRTLEEYRGENLNATILCTVTALNILYLTEFAEWIESQRFALVGRGFDPFFHLGMVHTPDHLSPQVLPMAMKEEAIRRWERFRSERGSIATMVDGALLFMMQADRSDLLPKLRTYLCALDKTRGTDFRGEFPELGWYLDSATANPSPYSPAP
jgi:hypothetical protein